MSDLKAEYGSMNSAARSVRTGVVHVPNAVTRFRQVRGHLDAFGHLPESEKVKHTVDGAMKQLADFGESLHAEWISEAGALTGIANVLRRVDHLLAQQAGTRE